MLFRHKRRVAKEPKIVLGRGASLLTAKASNPSKVSMRGEVTGSMLDMEAVLLHLAARRRVFHSEADFQFALAWQIQSDHPTADIRLETRPIPEENLRLDLFVAVNGRRFAVECKYLVREIDVTEAGERFMLRTQSAHDVRRYDTLKDVARVEQFVSLDVADEGFVVAVTNDAAYWRPARRPDTFDASFRMHEGRLVQGRLAWAEGTGAGSMKNREAAVDLAGSYRIAWRDFSSVGDGSASTFRYMLIKIPAEN